MAARNGSSGRANFSIGRPLIAMPTTPRPFHPRQVRGRTQAKTLADTTRRTISAQRMRKIRTKSGLTKPFVAHGPNDGQPGSADCSRRLQP
jgi:hypothetical protein